MITSHFAPRHILVVHKADHSAAEALARRLVCWLEARDLSVSLLSGTLLSGTLLSGASTPQHIPPDLVLVLGGDGTMIAVARAFVQRPVPLLGINFGRVGFLTELSAEQWEDDLARVLDGRCRILRRLALGWKVWRQSALASAGVAVNDVVISRGALSRVIHLQVSAGGQAMCRLRADGLIFSTPTGCSGYAVSAGGPLVHPDIDAVVITPICPFLSHFPPIVLPSTLGVQAQVLSEATETFLTADGQESVPLAHNDIIEIVEIPQSVLFARTREGTYFKRLKARGFIEENVSVLPVEKLL